MALSPIKFNKFQQSTAIVDSAGRPSPVFLRWINDTIGSIAAAYNQIIVIPEVQAAVAAAQAAADAANLAATNAQAAADGAQAAGEQTAGSSALANSYTTGATLTATDGGSSGTITISAHSRVYATTPPTTVAVGGGVLTGLAYDTQYFVYYDQPTRAGGSVPYVATTTQTDVAQINDRHSVGNATTPLAAGAPNPGYQVSPPGGNYEQLP